MLSASRFHPPILDVSVSWTEPGVHRVAGLIFFTDAVAADQQPRTDTPTYTKRARYWRSGSGLIAGSANRSIRCGEATRCSTDPEPGHRARAMGGEYAE